MQIYVEDFLEMAPSDKQFDELKKRVTGLEGISPSISWNQRNPLLTWLISITVPIIAVGIAFYAGVIPHIEKHIDDRVKIEVTDGLKQPLQDISKMSNDIAEIKGTIKAWAPLIVPGVLKRNSSVNQDEFNKSLPALREAVEVATQTKAIVPNETLQQIAQKLRQASESSPDYWPTVLQFIQFASAGLSPDVPPPGKPNLELHSTAIRGRNIFGTIKNRIVLLDGGELVDQRFENSRIIFTEQPVRMQNVEFVNCVFEMPSVESPIPYLKQVSQELLASNLNSVRIKAL